MAERAGGGGLDPLRVYDPAAIAARADDARRRADRGSGADVETPQARGAAEAGRARVVLSVQEVDALLTAAGAGAARPDPAVRPGGPVFLQDRDPGDEDGA